MKLNYIDKAKKKTFGKKEVAKSEESGRDSWN